MRTSPLSAEVSEVEDGIKENSWNDWTPRENRVLVRSAQVVFKTGHLSVTEMNPTDPRTILLYASLRDRRSRTRAGEVDMEVTADELTEIIEALTLLRDTAINNWMLEPAV